MLLKHADQLVREGKFEDALKVISRAREADPGNIYALAYEERVLALLNGHRQRMLNPGAVASGEQHLLPPVDEQMAELVAIQKESGCPEQLMEDMRARVAMMLSRAYELRNRGEFDSALDEVSRAFLIDSTSPELIRLERQLWKERNISVMRVRARNGGHPGAGVPPDFCTPEKGESVLDVYPTGSRPMAEEASAGDSEIQRIESDREIVRHLQRARDLLAAGQFENALLEIESVRRMSPADDQATRIEQLILTKQEESARTHGPTDEIAAILATTNKLRSLRRYDEALREIERASVLEPRNASIQKCIAEIRQEITDHASASVTELLAEAEAFRQRRDYTSALNILTGAYTIAPESREVRKLEMAIRREELLQHESG
jgi:tetratricopeptide (TPR) repeat protein